MPYNHFTIEEREKIQELWWERRSVRFIARTLGRSPSSVSRELSKNFPSSQQKLYTPRLAHERALKHRTHRGRLDRLKNTLVRQYVITHLRQGWSPEQIAGRIKIDLRQSISHEAIYQYIYDQVQPSSDVVRAKCEDLRPCLRFKRKRRTRKGMRSSQRFGYIRGVSIAQRPTVVAVRSRIGDWEGDTVVSKDHRPGINTLVDRKSGLLCMTKLTDNTGDATAKAVASRLSGLPAHTLTVDNGPENSRWQRIESEVGLACFFANPYHSWERGTNENTNGLIREYFPKRTDFSIIPDNEIAAVELLLNSRPRKRLGFRTPLEVFSVALQS